MDGGQGVLSVLWPSVVVPRHGKREEHRASVPHGLEGQPPLVRGVQLM